MCLKCLLVTLKVKELTAGVYNNNYWHENSKYSLLSGLSLQSVFYED